MHQLAAPAPSPASLSVLVPGRPAVSPLQSQRAPRDLQTVVQLRLSGLDNAKACNGLLLEAAQACLQYLADCALSLSKPQAPNLADILPS